MSFLTTFYFVPGELRKWAQDGRHIWRFSAPAQQRLARWESHGSRWGDIQWPRYDFAIELHQPIDGCDCLLVTRPMLPKGFNPSQDGDLLCLRLIDTSIVAYNQSMAAQNALVRGDRGRRGFQQLARDRLAGKWREGEGAHTHAVYLPLGKIANVPINASFDELAQAAYGSTTVSTRPPATNTKLNLALRLVAKTLLAINKPWPTLKTSYVKKPILRDEMFRGRV
ncbi:hypothetical protein CMO96_01375, partial [Candidatus Woesebacteria bacterium]|nr:hypothetical protein [Candidatus Woesebacteria bacterium]